MFWSKFVVCSMGGVEYVVVLLSEVVISAFGGVDCDSSSMGFCLSEVCGCHVQYRSEFYLNDNCNTATYPMSID